MSISVQIIRIGNQIASSLLEGVTLLLILRCVGIRVAFWFGQLFFRFFLPPEHSSVVSATLRVIQRNIDDPPLPLFLFHSALL